MMKNLIHLLLKTQRHQNFKNLPPRQNIGVNNYLGIRSAPTSLQQVDEYKMNTFEVEHPSICGLAVTQIL